VGAVDRHEPALLHGALCTLFSIEPGAPVLLAGVRDELVDRAAAAGTVLAGLSRAGRSRDLSGRRNVAGSCAGGAARSLRSNGEPDGARWMPRSRGVLPLQVSGQRKLGPRGP